MVVVVVSPLEGCTRRIDVDDFPSVHHRLVFEVVDIRHGCILSTHLKRSGSGQRGLSLCCGIDAIGVSSEHFAFDYLGSFEGGDVGGDGVACDIVDDGVSHFLGSILCIEVGETALLGGLPGYLCIL